MYREDLPGTREILLFPYLKTRLGKPGDQHPGPLWVVLAGNGSEQKEHEDGTGGRVNEPPGTGSRKSERPIVPTRPGD
jgi:hypothetical protein